MKKGISLISLFITILIMLILATTATVSGINALNDAKLTKFASELSQIQNLVDSYKEANLGEYPIGDLAVIDISGLTAIAKAQFADETKVNSTKVNLFVIDMSLLSKTDLTYGNKKTETDVYVVSKETGKVYYAAGYKLNENVYYTLTSDLLEIIDYDNSIKAVNKDGILFTTTNSNWTNGTVDVVVKVPDNSKYIVSTVSVKSGTITLNNLSLSSAKGGYKIYNAKGIDQNCDIVVSYSKEGSETLTQTYSVTNIDKIAPKLVVEKQEGLINEASDDKNVYIKVSATDTESDIAYTKYESEEIEQSLAKEYFISNGFTVKDGVIIVDRFTSVVTVYTQDKAGNGTYQKIELTTAVADEKDYVQDGLVIHYDGINNTGTGHSTTTTTWKNLASNNYDGTLKDFDYTTTSGWTTNSLKFDGTNDWVSIGEFNPEKVTLEAVVKYDSIDNSEIDIIGNTESGGYSIWSLSRKNNFGVYVKQKNGYLYVSSANNNEIDKIYSLSGSYNNEKVVLYENGNSTVQEYYDEISKTLNDTILVLGVEPKGKRAESNVFLNGEIMSIRVYNRALSEEEVKKNYRIDKIRFGVD